MARKKTKSIVVRFNDEEYEQFKKLVQDSRLKQQEYSLKCLLSKKVTIIEGYSDFRLELKRVGTNLNQLAKSLNIGLLVEKDLKEVLEELKLIWQQLGVFLQKHQ